MKIYLSHPRNETYKEELYKPLRESELNNEFEFILPHESTDTPFNSRELLNQKKCDLVIAEVSQAATGQGIELGWADANDIPIICIHKKGSKVSGSLIIVCDEFIEYSDPEELTEKLKVKLVDYPKN